VNPPHCEGWCETLVAPGWVGQKASQAFAALQDAVSGRENVAAPKCGICCTPIITPQRLNLFLKTPWGVLIPSIEFRNCPNMKFSWRSNPTFCPNSPTKPSFGTPWITSIISHLAPNHCHSSKCNTNNRVLPQTLLGNQSSFAHRALN